MESEGLRFDTSWVLRILSLSHARDETKRHSSLSLPRSTRAGFAPRNTLIVAGLNELNSSFRALLSSPQSRWPALYSSVNVHP